MDLGIDVVEGLSSLVDKNLAQATDRGTGETRFSMLQTIREFAAEMLAQSGEQPSARRSHAAYCLVIAEEGNPDLNPEQRNQWLTRCDHEIDNFRLALDWTQEAGEQEWGLRLGVALFRFWDMREHLAEGRARLEAVLRLAGTKHAMERARVALFVGALAVSQGDNRAAEEFHSTALELYEELKHEPGIAAGLNALAIVARDRGDHALAQSRFERSLACWRMVSDQFAVARCLHNLATVVKIRGDYGRAIRALREASEIFEKLGDRSGAAWSMNQLGDVHCASGDVAKGRECYEQALAAFRQARDPWGAARSLTDLGYIDLENGCLEESVTAFRKSLEIFGNLRHRRGIARVLEGYASLAMATGSAGRALTLAAAASRIRRQIDAPLSQNERLKVENTIRSARSGFSALKAEAAWSEGTAMSVDDAIAYAFGQGLLNPST